MRKVVKVIFMGMLLLVFSGCGKSAQDVFTDNLTQQLDDETYNAVEFSVKVDKLDFETSTENSTTAATMSVLAGELKKMKLTGRYLADPDKEAIEYYMKAEALGQTIPMEFIVTEDAYYYTTEPFYEITMLVSNLMGNSDVQWSVSKDSFKSEYLKLTDDDFADMFDFVQITPGKQSKVLTDFTKTLEEDSFTTTGDVTSHTYDKKELADFLDYAKENGTDELKDMLEDVDSDVLDDFDKCDLKVSINDKTKKSTYKLSVKYENDGNSLDGALTLTMTPEKSDEMLNIPGDSRTMSMDEYNKVLSASVRVKMTDDDFAGWYATLSDLTDYYTKEEVAELLSPYVLTAEQQAKIDELFP